MQPELPVQRDLTRSEIDELLDRNHVARMAYGRRARIDIFPFHYVRDENWIYGRTSPGGKLTDLTREWYVAVLVDEIDGLYDWRSVVVHGGYYRLDPASPQDATRYAEAVEALRTVVPEALTDDDPVPQRSVVFGVVIQERSGRSSTTVRAASERPRGADPDAGEAP